ncbi:efflux RND transporter permease subunit [Ensifer sp. MJa1]
MAELGIGIDRLSNAVRVATIGEIDPELALLEEPGRSVPIRVEVEKVDGSDLALIENLPLRTASGEIVPLVAVAGVVSAFGPSHIQRRDGLRRIGLRDTPPCP